MAIIKNDKDFSTIQIRKDIHFVFGNLESDGSKMEKIKKSLKAFNAFFEVLGQERPVVVMDWKKGGKGDWVLSDDYRVVQILNRTENKRDNQYNEAVIRTCVGTFAVNAKTFFDTDFDLHPDRYRISNKNKQNYERVISRKETTANEKLFASKVARGQKPEDAYMQTFKTDNRLYAKDMSKVLLRQERVHSTVSSEVESIMEDEGVSKRYIIQKYKELIDDGLLDMKNCSGSVRAALKDLADMSAMMPSKQTQSASTRGVFEIEDEHLLQIEQREADASQLKERNDDFDDLNMIEHDDIEVEEEYNEVLSETGKSLLQ